VSAGGPRGLALQIMGVVCVKGPSSQKYREMLLRSNSRYFWLDGPDTHTTPMVLARMKHGARMQSPTIRSWCARISSIFLPYKVLSGTNEM